MIKRCLPTLPVSHQGLAARVRVPSSKSLTNRALIAAAAAGGGSIRQPLRCDDTWLLAKALGSAGWQLDWQEQIEVAGHREPAAPVQVDLGASGTGSRLLLALLAAVPGCYRIDGCRRLRERPMAPLLAALRTLGGQLDDHDGRLPVEISGRRLAGGHLRLQPGSSSQFVSALLLAAPLMARPLQLELVGLVPSQPYLDLTEEVLLAFGATVNRDQAAHQWQVAGPLHPVTYSVEGDWSAAAFFLAAAAVAGGTVEIRSLNASSRQGDRAICDLLAGAGVQIDEVDDGVRVTGPAHGPLEGNLRDMPDTFPALAAVAACLPYRSRLCGLENLRHKESDRLQTMVSNLGRLGAVLEVDQASMTVVEPIVAGSANGTPVTAAADHRIAMAMAVTALSAGPLQLDDGACVQKSFPGFWQAWEQLLR